MKLSISGCSAIPVAGLVPSVKVDAGDAVRAGQLLAEMDSGELAAMNARRNQDLAAQKFISAGALEVRPRVL